MKTGTRPDTDNYLHKIHKFVIVKHTGFILAFDIYKWL